MGSRLKINIPSAIEGDVGLTILSLALLLVIYYVFVRSKQYFVYR